MRYNNPKWQGWNTWDNIVEANPSPVGSVSYSKNDVYSMDAYQPDAAPPSPWQNTPGSLAVIKQGVYDPDYTGRLILQGKNIEMILEVENHLVEFGANPWLRLASVLVQLYDPPVEIIGWDGNPMLVSELYTEMDWYRAPSTTPMEGGSFKVTQLAQLEPGSGLHQFTVNITDLIIQKWGQALYDLARLYYFTGVTVEIRDARAVASVRDVIIQDYLVIPPPPETVILSYVSQPISVDAMINEAVLSSGGAVEFEKGSVVVINVPEEVETQ